MSETSESEVLCACTDSCALKAENERLRAALKLISRSPCFSPSYFEAATVSAVQGAIAGMAEQNKDCR